MTTKHLSPYQACWAQFLSEFNFEIQYWPGSKAILLDTLNRLLGDKSTKATDIRLAKRHRILFPLSKLNLQITTKLAIQETITLKPMRIFIFDTSQSIDQLITEAYQTSVSITKLIQAIQNLACCFWSKEFRKTFQIVITEYKVIERRFYFQNRLYILENKEICLQILYRTHALSFNSHSGYVKTLDLLQCTY